MYENGRVTVMFCSFGPSPRILRLFCRGEVVERGEGRFEGWVGRMGKGGVEGARAVVLLEVWKVGGWGVVACVRSGHDSFVRLFIFSFVPKFTDPSIHPPTPSSHP